jgi:hypothetical protein
VSRFLIFAGTLGAFLIRGSIFLIGSAGADAAAKDKGLADAAGGLLTLLVSLVAKAGERATPGAFARRFVCARYQSAFNSDPTPGTERTAFDALNDACSGTGSWGVKRLKRFLAAAPEAFARHR